MSGDDAFLDAIEDEPAIERATQVLWHYFKGSQHENPDMFVELRGALIDIALAGARAAKFVE